MILKELLDHRGNTVSIIQSDTNNPEMFHHILREDCEPMIQDAKLLSEHLDARSDLRPVAHVPAAVVQQMMMDGSWDDEQSLKRWLNDPDNKAFRIWPGRI